MKHLIVALKITILLTVVTGLIYPVVVTGLAQLIFPRQANGSLIQANGKVVGSELLGQGFARPEYFHGRPSAAGTNGYDGTASGGSNLGPTSRKLVERVEGDLKKFHDENPGFTGEVPADLVTASASGLDPHISPASAEAQVERVATARGESPEAVRSLLAEHTEGRQ